MGSKWMLLQQQQQQASLNAVLKMVWAHDIQNSPGNWLPTTKNRNPGATLDDDAKLLHQIGASASNRRKYVEVLGLYQTEDSLSKWRDWMESQGVIQSGRRESHVVSMPNEELASSIMSLFL